MKTLMNCHDFIMLGREIDFCYFTELLAYCTRSLNSKSLTCAEER